MNFKKYLYSATLLGLGIGLLASCDESKTIEYVPAHPTGEIGDVAYFSVTTETSYELFADQNTIVIPVYRTNPQGALEIPVTVEAAANYEGENPYSFPSSIVFADGQEEAEYTVTYNFDMAVKGQERTYYIRLDEKYSSPYAENKLDYISLSLLRPSWTILGDAVFIDDFAGIAGEFALSQNDDDPSLFRIAAPYYAMNDDSKQYFVFQLLEEGSNYVDYFGDAVPVVAEASNWVAFQPAFLFNDEGLDFYAIYPAALGYPGNYCYVAEYQKNGLPGEIRLSPLYYNPSDGYWYGDTSSAEYVTILFPDFVPSDVSIGISFVDFNPNTGDVTVSVDNLGADVTSVRIGIGQGGEENAATIAAAIEKDELDYVTTDKLGNILVPFTYTESGQYTIVAVSYLDETPREISSVTIAYSSGADPNQGWTSLGYVDYTDGYMCANPVYFLAQTLEQSILTYPVEIQEWDDYPGVYRLVNPYGEAYPWNEPGDYLAGYNCYLAFDVSVPDEVFVDFTEQTLDWKMDGNGYALKMTGSWAAFYLYYASDDDIMTPNQVAAEGMFGTFKDGKVTFPANMLCANWNFENSQFTELNDYIVSANYVMDYEGWMAQGGNDNPDAEPYYYVDGEIYAPFCIDFNTLSDVPSGAAALSTRTLKSKSFNYVPASMKPALTKSMVQKAMKKAAKMRQLKAQGKMTGKSVIAKKTYEKAPF